MIGSGEYISRNAAIEAMYKDAEANPNHTFWTSQFEALMDIHAADVRPARRGKRIGTHDTAFMTHIIGEICNYAVTNGMEPDDTLETVADNILSLLEICTFNNWTPKEEDE